MANRIIPDHFLFDLGSGAQVAAFGLRACIKGHAKCCHLISVFNDFFGARSGGNILDSISKFSKNLKKNAEGELDLAEPNDQSITYDEAAILNAISAMQAKNAALASAYLHWLLKQRPSPAIMCMLSAVSEAFGSKDWHVAQISTLVPSNCPALYETASFRLVASA